MIGLLLLVSAFAVYMQNSPKVQQTPGRQNEPGHMYRIEKTGAGSIVDFSAAAETIHAAVDGAISKAGWTVRDTTASIKETPRQTVEGTLRWHVRQLLIQVPAGVTPDGVRQTVEAAVKPANGIIVAVQPDKYLGNQVTRVDIGLRDSLAGDTITIITDKIYIIETKSGGESAKTKPEQPGAIRGELALLIDDFGYSYEPINAFAAMGRPITFAVLPNRTYSLDAANKGVSSGQQVMVHMPMEALSSAAMVEPLTVNVNMTESEIREAVTKLVQSVPGAIGVNNHQGSRATADRRVMKIALGVIKENKMFFVDSRTNTQSIAYEVAKQLGMRSGENELFLDNDNDIQAIKNQLRIAGERAVRSGRIIVIGHARMTTATAVKEMIPELEASGVKLIFVSQALK